MKTTKSFLSIQKFLWWTIVSKIPLQPRNKKFRLWEQEKSICYFNFIIPPFKTLSNSITAIKRKFSNFPKNYKLVHHWEMKWWNFTLRDKFYSPTMLSLIDLILTRVTTSFWWNKVSLLEPMTWMIYSKTFSIINLIYLTYSNYQFMNLRNTCMKFRCLVSISLSQPLFIWMITMRFLSTKRK